MLTRPKRLILFWASVFIFLAMMPVVTLYALGYRLDESWNLKKTGGIYVSSDISGSEIFIDGIYEDRTNLLQAGAFIDNLSPGTYEIQVLNEGYLPWKKKLTVDSQLVTEARSLLVPEVTNAQILLRGNFSTIEASERDPVIILTEERTDEKIIRWYLPEERGFLTDTGSLLRYKTDFEIVRWLPGGVVLRLDDKPFRVSFSIGRGTASVVPIGNEPPEKTAEEIREYSVRRDDRDFVEVEYFPTEGTLSAKWIDESIILPYYFQQKEQKIIENKVLKSFSFYPGRRDVILAAYDNGLWALEIDSREERIILPVYKGKDPDFAILPANGELYVIDDGILMEVKLRTQ